MEARRLLDGLADTHLLNHIANERYAFHDLLRAYANEQIRHVETADERTQAIHRLLDWYMHAVNTAERHLARTFNISLNDISQPRYPLIIRTQSHALQWMNIEAPNLLAVAHYAAERGMHRLAWQLSAAGAASHLLPIDDQVSMYRAGLNAARQTNDRYGELWMLHLLGEACAYRYFSDSIDAHQQALTISREVNEPSIEAFSLNGIGLALQGLGRFVESIEFHQQALVIWREAGDEWATGIGMLNLGEIHRNLREFDLAEAYYSQAERIFRAKYDKFRESGVWEGRGDIAMELGRYVEAIELYSNTMAVNRNSGHHYYEIGALSRLGLAWMRAGDSRQARRCWEEALAIGHRFRDPRIQEVSAWLSELDCQPSC